MTTTSKFDVFVVDVCGTLVRDDTTLGLLEYHFSRGGHGRARLLLLRAMRARASPLRLAFSVVEKITGRHFLKHFAVRLLAGERADDVDHSAKEYAAHLLRERRISSVWLLLGYPLSSGHVVLASASLDPVVAALAGAIGASHVASKLEEDRGVFTGRYLTDLTGAKERALLEIYGSSFFDGQICVISDNLSDRALLERAARAYVVLHQESHLSRWRGLEATFVGIDE